MFELIVLGSSLLVLGALGFVVAAAFQRHANEQLLIGLQLAFVALWVFGMLFAALVWIVGRDWVHTLWAAAIPLTFLLLLAGPFLFAWASPEQASINTLRIERRRLVFGWAFASMTLALGALPLALVTVLPAMRGRNTGDAPGRVAELVVWGFGGPLPDVLTPMTAQELARGVGHLPREVSLPISALMQASWVILLASALAVAGRWLPGALVRRTFLLLAPVAVGVLLAILAARRDGSDPGPFDARLFVPISDEYAGLWTSDPAALQSFGPVLLLALLAALLLPPIVALRPRTVRDESLVRVDPTASPGDEFDRAPSRG